MFIGEGRHTPNHFSAEGQIGGLDDIRAIDFMEPAFVQFGDDKVTVLGKHPKLIAWLVFDDERRT